MSFIWRPLCTSSSFSLLSHLNCARPGNWQKVVAIRSIIQKDKELNPFPTTQSPPHPHLPLLPTLMSAVTCRQAEVRYLFVFCSNHGKHFKCFCYLLFCFQPLVLFLIFTHFYIKIFKLLINFKLGLLFCYTLTTSFFCCGQVIYLCHLYLLKINARNWNECLWRVWLLHSQLILFIH